MLLSFSMARLLFTLFLFLTFGSRGFAEGLFDPTMKYSFRCAVYGAGSLMTGAAHGSTAYLYYSPTMTGAEDSWWYIREDGDGYVITNAATKEYITYNAERVEGVAKGLVLTATAEDNASRWTLVGESDYWSVRSVLKPDQWWNLRTDGTGLLGTYGGSGSQNELFAIYDENGNIVTPSGSGGGTTPDLGDFATYIDSVRLGGKQLVYDLERETFYASIPPYLQNGGDFATTLTIKPKASYASYTVRLDDLRPEDGSGNLTIPTPDPSTTYTLAIYNDEAEPRVVASAPLRLTYLPIVEVNVDYCEPSYYREGSIRVTDGATTAYDSVFPAAFRYRGASSLNRAKKSFAVKLRDGAGRPVDRSFFGLRSDNNWILDAMAVDPACMRNRLSTDLWNAFSVKPYHYDREPKMKNGTRGRFVEVFYNGAYHGVFCMTEKVDRKQLRLKKYLSAAESAGGGEEIHGALYKATEWSYETFMGHYQGNETLYGSAPAPYDNRLGYETWAAFEIKYPDFEEEAVEWEPLWRGINFVATSNQATFDRELKNYFDYPVLKDYYLFIELLLATDNHGKNMFYYVYDRRGKEGDRLGVAPWDLDGVWGARWDASTHLTTPEQDFDEFIRYYEHGHHTIFIRLRQSREIRWSEELAERYAELRADYFNVDYLSAAVDKYTQLLTSSRAAEREERKWPEYHSDISGSANYLKTWMATRIETLDEKYGFDPEQAGMNDARAESYFLADGGEACLFLSCGKPRYVEIYTAAGTLVRTETIAEGTTRISGLSPGIYIVNGKKVVVR